MKKITIEELNKALKVINKYLEQNPGVYVSVESKGQGSVSVNLWSPLS